MEQIRRRKDEIDMKILHLIAERLRLMDYARDIKAKKCLPLVDKLEKKRVYTTRLELAKELKIHEKFAKKLMKVILAGCQKHLLGRENMPSEENSTALS